MESIEGALLDVDGTLLDGDRAIPGAPGALAELRRRGIPFRLTTNTTRRPRSDIAAVLRDAGIEVSRDEILIPASLARRRILDSGRRRALLLVPERSREDFEGIESVTNDPDWIVIGDLGRDFTFERLNEAFRCGREGARLLALQKNRYWNAGQIGEVLDAGPFVAALEYALGTEAEIVGKPSRAFFDLALADLGVPAGRTVCIGDNLENDCLGARRAGCVTALVATGTYDAAAVRRSGTRPDFVFASIADLKETTWPSRLP